MKLSIYRLGRQLLTAFIAATVLVLAACASAPAPTPSLTPSIKITLPAEGSLLLGCGSVPVSVKVTNFNIVDKLGQPDVAGEGHILYFMDVNAPTEPGKPAETAAGTYVATANTTYYWPALEANGTHTLSAELVNNDNTPLNPPAVARVMVTVDHRDLL